MVQQVGRIDKGPKTPAHPVGKKKGCKKKERAGSKRRKRATHLRGVFTRAGKSLKRCEIKAGGSDQKNGLTSQNRADLEPDYC